MALAKKYRLKKRKDFEAVKKKGKLISGPLFSLLVLKEKSTESKFAFIVSKKIDKRAVVRNKIRRRLAEAVRQILPKISANLKVVFLAKPNLKEAKFEDIIRELKKMALAPRSF